MNGRRVGVLMGGLSAEREVSLKTGEGVAEALRARGVDVVPIDIGGVHGQADIAIRNAAIDVAFIALHGRGGEDGTIQGLLELMRIPYTGSSVLASALAMDKLKAKEVFRLHNVPTPPYYTIQAASDADLNNVEEEHGTFGYPAVVKPRSEGSSVGVTIVRGGRELRHAARAALAYDDTVIVERFIRAREVHVGILDGEVLGAVEIEPEEGFYDYDAKYVTGRTAYHVPPRISPTRLRGVMKLGQRAASALGCTGACRVDLLVTEGENEFVLEVNTLPGMTPSSLLPKIAAHAGLDYGALCEKILASAKLHADLGGRRRAPRRSHVSVRTEPAAQSPITRRVG